MSDCKIYPADTVDIYGNVWPTVGENIRNGMFGKLKVAKIKIDGKNITSSDIQITTTTDTYFRINEHAIFTFIDKVYLGTAIFQIGFDKHSCMIRSIYNIESIKADISIMYTE